MDFVPGMFPYHHHHHHHHQPAGSFPDYPGLAYSSQRQSPVNPAFTHSCILELRKEKSRDAARSRRGKENYEFYELAKMLPLPGAITSQLDKASIVRLTISYLKLREFSIHGDPPWNREGAFRSRITQGMVSDLFEAHQGTHILQVEMTGSSVFDYVHHSDHAELAERLDLRRYEIPSSSPRPISEDGSGSNSSLSPKNDAREGRPDRSGGGGGGGGGSSSGSILQQPEAGRNEISRGFCIRMKSTLTKRGCHFKSSGYRVVLLQCYTRSQYTFDRKSDPPLLGIVCLAIALPPPSVNEFRLESDVFVTKMSFELNVIHCESRICEFCDWTSEEILNRNIYSLCHPQDLQTLKRFHEDLLAKGQVMSGYYRMLSRHGGFFWMQSCATVMCSSKNADERSIVCINYILSPELSHIIMDNFQMLPRNANSSVKSSVDYSPKSESRSSPENLHSSPSASVHASPKPRAEPAESAKLPAAKRKHPDDDEKEGLQGKGAGSPEEARPNWKKPSTDTPDASKENREFEPTDFSTSALLNKHRSTIQWIGSRPANSLVASNFLRHLRESVIVRPPSLFGELHGSLSTPPGAELFGEPYIQTYPYPNYHPPTVTPPSSVSPREKATLPDNPIFESTFRTFEGEKSYLPIRPQAFSSHLESSNFVHPDTQLYTHPTQAFNLYHSKLSYPEGLKNGTNWYHPST